MPNPRILNRRLHRWGAILVALPFLVVIATGLLLQVKKQFAWVQPPERRGGELAATLTFGEILARAQAVPQAGVRSWADVERLDVRPDKGLVKVVSRSRWELQLDAATGAVLQSTYRRSDLIESLHDGSWFHPLAKTWIFLPAGAIVLGLWLTGIYLWLLPYQVKRKRAASQ